MPVYVSVTIKKRGRTIELRGTVTPLGHNYRIVIEDNIHIRRKMGFRRIVLFSGSGLNAASDVILSYVKKRFGQNARVDINFSNSSKRSRYTKRENKTGYWHKKGKGTTKTLLDMQGVALPDKLGSVFDTKLEFFFDKIKYTTLQSHIFTRKSEITVIPVPIFYATDREQIKFPDGSIHYNAKRGNHLSYGMCTVTLPEDRKPGELPRPTIWGIQYRPENAKKDVVIVSNKAKNESDFFAEIKSIPEDSALLFIHGYNNDFNSAIHRTAQLKVDLNFAGPTFCYSWPSRGTILEYAADDTTVQATELYLKEFINNMIQKTDIKSLCIIAHSMGNRAVTSVLREMSNTQSFPIILKQLILAAPDIDRDIFINQIVPAIRGKTAITLYASARDRALWISELFRARYPRAGDAGDSLVITAGVETIDASKIPDGILSHSYFSNVKSVIDDIFQIVRHNHPASQRNLLAKNRNGMPYWELP